MRFEDAKVDISYQEMLSTLNRANLYVERHPCAHNNFIAYHLLTKHKSTQRMISWREGIIDELIQLLSEFQM